MAMLRLSSQYKRSAIRQGNRHLRTPSPLLHCKRTMSTSDAVKKSDDEWRAILSKEQVRVFCDGKAYNPDYSSSEFYVRKEQSPLGQASTIITVKKVFTLAPAVEPRYTRAPPSLMSVFSLTLRFLYADTCHFRVDVDGQPSSMVSISIFTDADLIN